MPAKIVYVLNYFLPEQVAGTEVYVWALSKQLIKRGWEVIVLIPNFGINDCDEYVFDDIRVIKYPEPSGEKRDIILGIEKPMGLKFFESILKEEHPDILHFHEYSAGSGIGIEHFKIGRAHV